MEKHCNSAVELSVEKCRPLSRAHQYLCSRWALIADAVVACGGGVEADFMVEQDGDDLHCHRTQLPGLGAVCNHGHQTVEEPGQHACHLQVQESRLQQGRRGFLLTLLCTHIC